MTGSTSPKRDLSLEEIRTRLIELSLDLGALAINIDKPFRWVSGYRMPVYNDNRRLYSHPEARNLIREGFLALIEGNRITWNGIAGTASAGIAPATTLADTLGAPLYYVRGEQKGHGMGRRIEGMPRDGLTGQEILLIEDLLSTGGSSVSAAQALIEAGATVTGCVAIFSYQFPGVDERFSALPGRPAARALVTITDLIDHALRRGAISEDEMALLGEWRKAPFAWGEKRGFPVDSPRDDQGTSPTEPGHIAGTGTPQIASTASRSAVGAAEKTAERIAAHLENTARGADTILCVGIDPRLEQIPPSVAPQGTPGERVRAFCDALLDTITDTGTVPGAFKPNIAYFHRLDRPREGDYGGSRALASILDRINREFPATPVILDAKRGDIAESSRGYAEEAFDAWNVDALTVSPLMGDDSVGPFLELATTRDRWVYILNRTSNPGSRRFQNGSCDGAPLAHRIARGIGEWQERYGTAGAVIGATSPEDLAAIVTIHRTSPIPILVPGVGAQGGDATTVIQTLRDVGYPLSLVRVNVSRGITAPWGSAGSAPSDWQRVVAASYTAHREALRWR